MIATMTKIGEGAFADVFGCQKEGWKKLAIKVTESNTSLKPYKVPDARVLTGVKC